MRILAFTNASGYYFAPFDCYVHFWVPRLPSERSIFSEISKFRDAGDANSNLSCDLFGCGSGIFDELVNR